MIVKKQQLLITQIKWITMKKIKSIIILSVVIFSAVLYSIEKQWYDKEGHINILKTCAMYSPIGTVGANGQIKANGIDVGYLAYGPYVQLKAGKYAIKYKLILNNLNMDDDSGRVVGYCDVDIEGHPEPAYHIDMTVGDFKKKNPREVMLKFTVPDGLPKVQFRVYQYYGNNHMLLGLKLYPKSLSLLTSLLKNNFLTYNVILFSTIFFIFLCIYFKIWKIYKLKLFFNKYKSFKFDNHLLFIILRFKKLVFFILFIIIAELWFLNIEHSSDILTGCAMYSPIGKLDSFMHIKANDTKEGYLAYGPYLPLEKGRYRVNYKVFLDNLDSGDDISRKVGYCDIDIEGHPELRKFSEFTVGSFKKRNPQEVSLTFSVPEGMPKTQYRVYQYGGNKLTLSSLKLYDVDITKYIRTHLDILLIAIFITIIFI